MDIKDWSFSRAYSGRASRNLYSADVCFNTMPPFLYLVTFSCENNTKFCLRIDRDFIPEFRNRDVDFFTSFKELNGSLKTNILLSRFLRLQKYGKCYKRCGLFFESQAHGFDSSILQRDCWRGDWRQNLSALVDKEHQQHWAGDKSRQPDT